MSEQCVVENYIKCSKCRCKYINDDDHIKNDFGYNRLNVRFKTCATCRETYRVNVKVTKEHEQKMAKRKIALQKIAERKRPVLHGDGTQCCTRCRNVRHVKEYGEYVDRVYLDGTEHWTPYKTCISCRNRDKR